MEFGQPEDKENLADFVLKQITDRTLINEAIVDARDAVIDILENGIDHTMNKYN